MPLDEEIFVNPGESRRFAPPTHSPQPVASAIASRQALSPQKHEIRVKVMRNLEIVGNVVSPGDFYELGLSFGKSSIGADELDAFLQGMAKSRNVILTFLS